MDCAAYLQRDIKTDHPISGKFSIIGAAFLSTKIKVNHRGIPLHHCKAEFVKSCYKLICRLDSILKALWWLNSWKYVLRSFFFSVKEYSVMYILYKYGFLFDNFSLNRLKKNPDSASLRQTVKTMVLSGSQHFRARCPEIWHLTSINVEGTFLWVTLPYF